MRANASSWPVNFAPRSAAERGAFQDAKDALIARAECRKLDIADTGSQQIVEIVRDAAGKLTDHFQLLGLAEALLHLPALRYIPHRAGEPEGTAVLVPIETALGNDPARFIVRPDNSAFEVEFSGVLAPG